MINGKQTEQLLRSISQRLSGREDCKDAKYYVKIDVNGIHMDPIIYVYPDCHKRKQVDKVDIVTYVYQYKMFGIHNDELVHGTYEYSSTEGTKKRKWRKLNEA